jgi:hypothetical protein
LIFDTTEFRFTRAFEERWVDIKREYEGLGDKVLDIHRKLDHANYVKLVKSNNGWMPSWQVGSEEPNKKWLTYGLCYRGIFPDEAPWKFPITASLLGQFKGVVVCAFSLMRPMSFIAPHNHPELGGNLLTYHLGIRASPGRNYLHVNGKFIEEQEGQSVIFDGSCNHFALNMSFKDRVILYMEFDKSKMDA